MAMMWDIENGYKDGHDRGGMFASSKENGLEWLSPHPSYYHFYFYNKILEIAITNLYQQVLTLEFILQLLVLEKLD